MREQLELWVSAAGSVYMLIYDNAPSSTVWLEFNAIYLIFIHVHFLFFVALCFN